MLLQTNSYIVPKEKRVEHVRLVRRFRQTLARLGCEHLEVYEQVGANWSSGETTGRFVQIMHFRDRKHQLAVQAAERNDAAAQALINEFCELINFPYQQQQGLFAVGFYQSVLPAASPRATVGVTPAADAADAAGEDEVAPDDAAVAEDVPLGDDVTDEHVSGVAELIEPDADDHVEMGNDDTSSDQHSAHRNA